LTVDESLALSLYPDLEKLVFTSKYCSCPKTSVKCTGCMPFVPKKKTKLTGWIAFGVSCLCAVLLAGGTGLLIWNRYFKKSHRDHEQLTEEQ
jgi:hypothetical protein